MRTYETAGTDRTTTANGRAYRTRAYRTTAYGTKAHGAKSTKAYGTTALCALLLATATACGVADGTEGGDRGTTPRSATLRERALLDRAEETLVDRCMDRNGFEYHPAPQATADELRVFPYVVDDPAWAREHGYGGALDRAAVRERKDNPNAAYVRTLPPDRRRAYGTTLYGDGGKAIEVTVPTGLDVRRSRTGCLSEAQGTLYGDLREWFRVDNVASNLPDHGAELRRAPDYRAAAGKWSACMTDRGHPYDSPDDVRRKLPALTKGASPDEAHAVEVRLATAEAECARRTPLAATVDRLARELARPDRERYAAEIEGRDRMRLVALEQARARELLPR
ncbi:hypothetical protein [Streptomyces sp. 184]|uniref:hypothetical protein n=1 Tax=Streptomyces sp. 184 TaxID=1827526 RepID=UPI0038920DF3